MDDIFSGITLYIIGYSGVGKTAVAHEVAKHTFMTLFDQDLIDKFINQFLEKEEIVYQKMNKERQEMKISLLDSILELSNMEKSFIYTDVLYNENSHDIVMFKKIEHRALIRGHFFIPIKLISEIDVLQTRYNSTSRINRNKNSRHNNPVKCMKDFTLIDINSANFITLDVTKLSIEQAAKEIISKIEVITNL